jgi:hypothetical protein
MAAVPYELQIALAAFMALAILLLFSLTRITRAARPGLPPTPRRKTPKRIVDAPSADSLKRRALPAQGAEQLVHQHQSMPDRVEFGVFIPSFTPPPHHRFHIEVDIDSLKEAESKNDDLKKAYETLVLPITQGSYVDLELQSKQLVIEVPYQRLQWSGYPITSVFVVQRKDLAVSTKCTLHIKINGCPLGRIPFDIEVEAGRKTVKALFSPGILDRQAAQNIKEGTGNGVIRYQSVFLSYTEGNETDVMHLAEGLHFGGAAVVFTQRTHMPPGGKKDWPTYAKQLIKLSDVVLLCWSSEAAGPPPGDGTPGIQEEIRCALDEETTRPAFQLIPLMIGDEDINDVPLPDSVAKLERPAVSTFHLYRMAHRRKSTSSIT